MGYAYNPFTGELDNTGTGGGVTSDSIKADTETVVQDVAKQITFASAFASASYIVTAAPFGYTITDKLATGFKITCDDSGTIQWIATLITE